MHLFGCTWFNCVLFSVATLVSIACESGQRLQLFVTFNPDAALHSLFAAWLLSLMTNIMATFLVGFGAWSVFYLVNSYIVPRSLNISDIYGLQRRHHKFIQANLPNESKTFKSERILALIVGSGVVYCIFYVGHFYTSHSLYTM